MNRICGTSKPTLTRLSCQALTPRQEALGGEREESRGVQSHQPLMATQQTVMATSPHHRNQHALLVRLPASSACQRRIAPLPPRQGQSIRTTVVLKRRKPWTPAVMRWRSGTLYEKPVRMTVVRVRGHYHAPGGRHWGCCWHWTP